MQTGHRRSVWVSGRVGFIRRRPVPCAAAVCVPAFAVGGIVEIAHTARYARRASLAPSKHPTLSTYLCFLPLDFGLNDHKMVGSVTDQVGIYTPVIDGGSGYGYVGFGKERGWTIDGSIRWCGQLPRAKAGAVC